MSEADNIKVVQSAYAAFGKGDIPALLETMDQNMDWHGVIGVGPNVPTGGPRHGKAAVGHFFQQVGETVTFKTFDAREFLAKGDVVVTLGFYSGVVKSTGRSFDLEWVMVMTLKGGKVVKFREYTDAAAVTAAY